MTFLEMNRMFLDRGGDMTTNKQIVFKILSNAGGPLTYKQIMKKMKGPIRKCHVTSVITLLSKMQGVHINKIRDGKFIRIEMYTDETFKRFVTHKDFQRVMSKVYDHKMRYEIAAMFDEYESFHSKDVTMIINSMKQAGAEFDVIKVHGVNAYKLVTGKPDPRPKKKKTVPVEHKRSFIHHLFTGNIDKAIEENKNMISNMA